MHEAIPPILDVLTLAERLKFEKMDQHCRHDGFLAAFCEAVKQEAEQKMAAAGIDIAALRPAL